MLTADLLRRGEHVMTVCNACRYCEAYCPVFPAMEERVTFAQRDLTYLANLCHNCGECLYACQYAPPHEFGINVPRTLAEIRLASYETYAWPPGLGVAFRRQPIVGAVLVTGAMVVMCVLAMVVSGDPAPGDFYQVVPHHVMVGLFSAVALAVVTAITIACRRFAGDIARRESGAAAAARAREGIGPFLAAIRDAMTLRHLHAAGEDCTDREESRTPWRRWLHHCTFYGFALCFASTSVAALYHVVFGWRAPYPYTSLPVILGTLGGIGLLVGPAGLFAIGRIRDEALADPAQRGLDRSFLVLLFLTSLTGLALMVLRDRPFMPALLVIHLASVLALFLMLPYGKFVHGIYRVAALVTFAREGQH